MHGALTLTSQQFNAINELYDALDIPKTSISEVSFGTTMTNSSGTAVFYLNVTFESGYGNREYTLNRNGNVVDPATIHA